MLCYLYSFLFIYRLQTTNHWSMIRTIALTSVVLILKKWFKHKNNQKNLIKHSKFLNQQVERCKEHHQNKRKEIKKNKNQKCQVLTTHFYKNKKAKSKKTITKCLLQKIHHYRELEATGTYHQIRNNVKKKYQLQ